MSTKKRVLIKLTGELFLSHDKKRLTADVFTTLISDLKELHLTHDIGMVIGGGNFFRGNQHGKALGLTASAGHQIGMLATMMNGLIIKDLLEQHGFLVSLFSALTCPEVGESITSQALHEALGAGRILVFVGGTGNPFFTTDTSAILRGLQMGAQEVWKGTSVDGVYSDDPAKTADVTLLPKLSYQQVLKKRYGIMDATAFALAAEHCIPMRIFNIFVPGALMRAGRGEDIGTCITS
ncbi:uridine monophosphate kinase [Candidatus Dependentiae bacterium]|nr:uridine monophosphate kinase [Candidatus Dependentiae bacterium]